MLIKYIDNLKPCPFCNGTALIIATKVDKRKQEYSVFCAECRVTQYHTYKTIEEAAKNWNERR